MHDVEITQNKIRYTWPHKPPIPHLAKRTQKHTLCTTFKYHASTQTLPSHSQQRTLLHLILSHTLSYGFLQADSSHYSHIAQQLGYPSSTSLPLHPLHHSAPHFPCCHTLGTTTSSHFTCYHYSPSHPLFHTTLHWNSSHHSFPIPLSHTSPPHSSLHPG